MSSFDAPEDGWEMGSEPLLITILELYPCRTNVLVSALRRSFNKLVEVELDFCIILSICLFVS